MPSKKSNLNFWCKVYLYWTKLWWLNVDGFTTWAAARAYQLDANEIEEDPYENGGGPLQGKQYENNAAREYLKTNT